MRLRRAIELGSLGLVLGAFGRACLPQTTLPDPGSLEITATAGDALLNGFTTDDGWDVHFDRALIALGRVSLDGSKDSTYCALYPDSRYTRLLDVKRPEPQKVALVYSLGHCDFSYSIQRGNLDSVTGEGLTTADRILMATPGSDVWEKNQGTSFYLEGGAKKGAVEKRFTWFFRRRVRYSACHVEQDDASDRGVTLSGSVGYKLNITIRAEALFQTDVDSAKAELRFQPFADADDKFGNADGEVTFDELHEMPLDGLGTFPIAEADGGIKNFDAGAVTTFGDYVYLELLPWTTRYKDTGSCTIEEPGGGGGRF